MAGGELRVSMAGPSPQAILAYKAGAGLVAPLAPGAESYTVTDGRTGVSTMRVAGQVRLGHSDPTPEEVSRINSVLAAMAGAKGE